MRGSLQRKLKWWGLGALFAAALGLYSTYAFIPAPHRVDSRRSSAVRLSSSPPSGQPSPPPPGPRYVTKPKRPPGRRAPPSTTPSTIRKKPSRPPAARPRAPAKVGGAGAAASDAGGATGNEKWQVAFKEFDAMEERSVRDYVELFDVCAAAARPYECQSVLRRMTRDGVPRSLGMYVRSMEVAVSIGGWGNVVDAYLQLEKRENLADIMRRSDEQQPGRGQAEMRALLEMALTACETLGKGGRAVTVFERGQSLLSPPLDRYSTSLQVLRACYRAGTDEPALPFALTALSPAASSSSSAELDLPTANMALSVLSRSNATTQAFISLTRSLPSMGLTPDHNSYAAVLEGAACEGAAGLALSVLAHMSKQARQPPSTRHVALAIRACCGGGELQTGWDMYDSRIRGGQQASSSSSHREEEEEEEEEEAKELEVGVLHSLLVAACREARPDLVDAIIGDLSLPFWPRRLRALPVSVVHPAICLLAKHGLADQAEALLQLFAKHQAGTAMGYYAMVAACEKAGQFERLLKWVEEMRTRGIPMDELRYSMALKACELLGRWEQGLDLMARMKDQGLPGNHIFWKRMLLLLGREGRGDEALAFLKDLRAEGHRLDPICYEAVITAYARQGERKKAHTCLDYFEKVLGVEIGKAAYTSAIAACRTSTSGGEVKREADWEMAMELFNRLQERGLEVTQVTKAALLEVLLASHRLDEARAMVADELASGEPLDPSLLPHVINLHVQSGEFESAVECFRSILELKRQDPKQVTVPWPTCNMVLTACAKTGSFEVALETLEVLRVQGMPTDRVMYGAALTACGQKGAWKEAMGLIRDMEDRGLKPNRVCYTSAITACQRGGEWRKALNIFLKMNSQGPAPDVAAYNAVMSACANAGEWQMALKIFKALQTQQSLGGELAPNGISYSTAIVACWRGEQYRPAVDILRAMQANGHAPNMITITLVIDACERAGKPDTATYVFDSTVVGAIRSECYDPDKSGPGMVVDLHGYTQAVARSAVRSGLKRLMQMYGNRGKDPRVIKDFVFITGIGRHSANPFEPVLRPAMQEMLERDFDPPLPCEPVRNNPGRLRVRAQDLVTWMNAQMAPKPKSPSQLVQGAFKLRMPEDLAADFHEWQQALIAAQRQQAAEEQEEEASSALSLLEQAEAGPNEAPPA